MSRCTDNPATGRVGCGATFGGEMQHCVALAEWSQHPDGRAHITARESTIQACWKGDTLRDPALLGFEPDARGVWRRPLTDEQREALTLLRRGAA